MSSGSEGSNDTNTFELSCTDCPFERTVEGSVTDALDVADSHQVNHGDSMTDHFVNFERLDSV